ncbi:hypothetical protein HYP58_gp04 [Vibrio phage 1.097.O._10N.286.49.B3]|uniref:Uncharacterized protein n=1 Tax=Vibrio phage 1.097.O._10N.286.49.B3 TaxID=1881383 RepID=A0A2I7R0G8_9CAUD|nr:hypothetical protein HYP58_gp04 [Vibrio phage 1.097.O._10N.286.49.B3]AUR87150.1 hypothetical protein NVP1097O_04 [Vibrio phage 1.097.O._10N.286.49.B3]
MTKMTEEDFKAALPAQMKKNVNTALLDKVNDLIANDDAREEFRDNIIGMSHVLKEGKFKLDSYVNAVRYIGFTMQGKKNQEAYALTFPDKTKKWGQMGKTAKDISAAVSIYNKSKLVNLVREAAMIPAAIYNADVFQEAVNTQAHLMRTAHSEKVRSDAAACLIKELRPPEIQKVELDIAVKEDSAIASLRDTTAQLVAQQRAMLQSQEVSARDIAEQKMVVIEGEFDEVAD